MTVTAARAPLPIHPPVPLTCNNTKTVVAPREFRDWLGALRDQAELLRAAGYFVMVPALMLSLTREVLSGTGIAYGGQDCAAESESVTGETPASHLADFGCTCVMLGQQQRRQLRGEDDTTVAAKAARAGEAGLVPVVCAGEAERCSPAEAAETVVAQVRPVMDQLPATAPLVVLYEPHWASPAHQAADARHVGAVQRGLDALRAGRPGVVRTLYGGAVTPGTWTALRDGTHLDGLHLGRAGIDAAVRAAVVSEILADPPAGRAGGDGSVS